MRIYDLAPGPEIDLPLGIIFGIVALIGLLILAIVLLVKSKDKKSDIDVKDEESKDDIEK